MKLRPIFFLIAVLLLAVANPSGARPIQAAQTAFGCSPAALTVRTGQSFYLTVVVSGAADLFAWQFDSEFNSAYLSFIKVVPGAFLRGDAAQRYTLAPQVVAGKAQRAAQTRLGRDRGVNGSGVIAYVYFQAVQDTPAVNVSLTNRKLVDRNAIELAHTALNSGRCAVTISAAAPYLEQPPAGETLFLPSIRR